MRYLVLLVLCCGCLSAETKILSRKIANSTKTQEAELVAIRSAMTSLDEEKAKRWNTVIKRARKLSEVTDGLADLLGAPEEVE